MALIDDVKRKLLDNGVEILVREDQSAPVVALNFFVRVGSLNEDDAIAGWSHGIEHMLFKGTHRRGTGDIAREIANAGGETNAGTGYESTNYYIVLPSRNLEVALDIHADVLQHSVFDEVELEKERQVLIQENAMYRDRPSGFGFTWEELLEEAFTVHRYRRPIGGPDENLLRVGRDDILRYKETYYLPNNLVYVVVGDVGGKRLPDSRGQDGRLAAPQPYPGSLASGTVPNRLALPRKNGGCREKLRQDRVSHPGRARSRNGRASRVGSHPGHRTLESPVPESP